MRRPRLGQSGDEEDGSVRAAAAVRARRGPRPAGVARRATAGRQGRAGADAGPGAAQRRRLIENIAVPPNVSENAHSGYSVDVRKHLIPGIGAHCLDRLEPEHLERLYAKMQRNGLAAGTAHHVHRTIRNALNEAVRRGYLGRNPVLLARAPKLTDEEPEPYTIEEVQRL